MIMKFSSRTLFVYSLSTAFVCFPALVLAAPGADQSGLIPCGNTANTNGAGVTSPCTFEDLIILAKNVIEFLIFKIAAPLAALMFAYAGYLMLTNNGNEGKVTQARSIFLYVFIGLIVAMAAWLTVSAILDFFDVPSAYRLFMTT